MSDTTPTETSTPVQIGRLSSAPAATDGRRVLGVVPGKPVGGERKEPADADMVMVWPHLLVRHAVAALLEMEGYDVENVGDGRAALLGELTDRFGQRRDLALKGSGAERAAEPAPAGRVPAGPEDDDDVPF